MNMGNKSNFLGVLLLMLALDVGGQQEEDYSGGDYLQNQIETSAEYFVHGEMSNKLLNKLGIFDDKESEEPIKEENPDIKLNVVRNPF
jgi:hypothetical protein